MEHERSATTNWSTPREARGSASQYEDCTGELKRLEHTHKSSLQSVLAHSRFELGLAGVIFLNSLFIGIEVDHVARHPQDDTPLLFKIVHVVFTAIFLVEWLVRIFAFGYRSFFCGRDNWAWHLLDTFVVLSSLFEIFIEVWTGFAADASADEFQNVSNVRVLRTIRMTRLVRILRISRLIRFVTALRTLVASIMFTMKSLIWSLVLLLIVIYVFGICFMQGTTTHYRDSATTNEYMDRYWKTLPDTMFTLFKSISGGISWDEAVRPMGDISWFFVGLFVCYVSFAYFAVLNVVTGVFCNSAIEATMRDPTIVAQSLGSDRQKHIQHIKELFAYMDAAKKECLTFAELERHMLDVTVQAHLRTLDIHSDDAWTLFKLMDTDGTNNIDVDEFVRGVLQLRGGARNVDLALMRSDHKKLVRKLVKFMKFTEEQFTLVKEIHQLNAPPQSQKVSL